jgi:hypothetical protein
MVVPLLGNHAVWRAGAGPPGRLRHAARRGHGAGRAAGAVEGRVHHGDVDDGTVVADWLTTRASIRASTLHSYTEHVERHLIPYLGSVRLGELTGRHIAATFTKLACTDTRYGRPPTRRPCTASGPRCARR